MVTPPVKEACFVSVEKCGLVVIHLFEYRPHQRLANKPAAIGDTVFLAEAVQSPILTLVEQDGYFEFAGLFFHMGLRVTGYGLRV